MANTVSIQYTCGCKFTHNVNGGAAQTNLDFSICATPHGLRTNPMRADIIEAAQKAIRALHDFRVLTGN